MKGFLNKLISLITLVVFCMTMSAPIYADDDITDTRVVESSAIYYPKMNRLLINGEHIVFDNSDGQFTSANNTQFVDVAFLVSNFNVLYTWDGGVQSLLVDDGKVCGEIPFKNLVDITKEDSEYGFFLGEHIYIPIAKTCDALGWGYYQTDDFIVICPSFTIPSLKKQYITALIDQGKDLICSYNFDDNTDIEFIPYYATGASASSFTQPCGIKNDGENGYLNIPAITEVNGGLTIPKVYIQRGVTYEISFDCAKSADYEGNSIGVYVHTYAGSTWQTYVTGYFTNPTKPNTWVNASLKVDADTLPEGATDLRIIFCTANKAPKVSGSMMYDNIIVRAVPKRTDITFVPKFKADKIGNWYVLGDTVTFTPQNKFDTEMYKKMYVEVLDSDDSVVFSEDTTAEKVNAGYSYKPTREGYYAFRFYYYDNFGRKTIINEIYTQNNPVTKEPWNFPVNKLTFVVTKHETKPMSERNPRLVVSIDPATNLNADIKAGRKLGLQGDSVAIADLMGFSTIRWHYMSPDGLNYRVDSKANMKRGDFDFSEWDGSFYRALDRGFDMVLDLMGSPRYSVPYRDGYTSPTGGMTQMYAPVDQEAWRAYVEYAVKRYKDHCNKWEIWNEPHVYGGSVFWKGITSDFSDIMKTAYNVIKKYQPGDQSNVAIGGIGARRYTNFWEEFVKTEGYDCFDTLAMHGWDIDPWKYNQIAIDNGKEPKPLCTTELHMMLRSSSSEYINNTDKEEAIRCIGEFLKDFKYNSIYTTFFQISCSHNVEWIRQCAKEKYTNQGVEGGAYYNLYQGIKLPRIATIAMNTFFDTMGKEYNYVDEYLLANKKQNVVRCSSDGKDQLIVWNIGGSKGINTILSSLITDAATDEFKIVDWEGHEIDTSDISNITIQKEKMYFISGLDGSKLDLIPSGQGDELYTGDVIYNVIEKEKSATGKELTHLVSQGSTTPLFDTNTFALADGINYQERFFRWHPSVGGNSKGDLSAKYALSVADDGMYVVARVADSVDNAKATAVSKMDEMDSITFAFDTVGDRSANGYMEVVCGIGPDGAPTVYKKTAPNIGGDIVADFISADNVIPNATFERTREGDETVYKVFIPTRQIYPYEKDIYSAIHFSIAVNENDGSAKTGIYEWGGGIGEISNPNEFGDVWIDAYEAESAQIYFPPMAEVNNTPIFDKETFEYCDNIIWHEDDINYVEILETDNSFRAKWAVGVTEEGLYVAAEVDDNSRFEPAVNHGALWKVDSMQFTIDPKQKGSSDDRIEFGLGWVQDKGITLYKEASPFVNADEAPEGYSQKATNIQNPTADIKYENNKIYYKVFIPAVEYYMFDQAEHDCMKMSFLFNQNTENNRIGYLEWASGIGASKNLKEYGLLYYR